MPSSQADWSLGRNPFNMIEMGTAYTGLAAKRSVNYMYPWGFADNLYFSGAAGTNARTFPSVASSCGRRLLPPPRPAVRGRLKALLRPQHLLRNLPWSLLSGRLRWSGRSRTEDWPFC